MGKKILIIDDEEEVCYFIKSILERELDSKVLISTRGLLGIEIAKRELPDLIILDLMMPDIDGSEVAQVLLQNSVTKDIPIVFLTALVQKKEVTSERGIIKGRKFIAKPVTPQELIHRVKEVLVEKRRV